MLQSQGEFVMAYCLSFMRLAIPQSEYYPMLSEETTRGGGI